MRWWAVASAVAGAALGSKILYWFESPALTLARWQDWAYLLGGKTVVGGLLGGLIAVELTKKLLGETRSTGDLFAVPLAVGIGIGRVGCFLTGLSDQTFGLPTRLPWGMDFGDGIPRHPTQLYEILFLGGVVLVLAWLRHRAPQSGDMFKTFMILYLAWRLSVDFLKPTVHLAGLGATAVQHARLLHPGPLLRRLQSGATKTHAASCRLNTKVDLPTRRRSPASSTCTASDKR